MPAYNNTGGATWVVQALASSNTNGTWYASREALPQFLFFLTEEKIPRTNAVSDIARMKPRCRGVSVPRRAVKMMVTHIVAIEDSKSKRTRYQTGVIPSSSDGVEGWGGVDMGAGVSGA